MSEVFSQLLGPLSEGLALNAEQAREFFLRCFAGEPNPAQLAAILMALKLRGETVTEILAGAQVLREYALPFVHDLEVMDTCGTGGDGAHTYNISTTVALVCAGAGLKIAKHGNRSVSSKSGSSEVLVALGVNIEPSHAQSLKALREAGVCFLYAPLHHQAMKHVTSVRRDLGLRTIFNLLGPLSNPAGAQRQVLGVYDRRWLEPVAQVLARLGAKRAMVVHGHDGLDELTLTGPSYISLWDGKTVTNHEINPEDFGLSLCDLRDLRGGDADFNAAALLRLLEGEKTAYRDIVALNTAAAFIVAECAQTWSQALDLAFESIDKGKARTALARLIEITNS
jgi:anthranilate phosphoribosyltransferase